ncbi:MAG: stearoyl-CoA 9-desaturase oxidoreductase [Pseudonocardiales bacterium]|nr:stearoyl-CoA 9-desaturase oxidoreductase [Pseudonocardiales bacterium]
MNIRALKFLEALATPHGVDRYLELVHPMLTVRDLRAVVTDVRRSTADSVTLTLRPTRQWRGFRAGQFVQVAVDIDGVRRTRCYSPSCSQYRADGRIELTVKAHPEGLVSQWLHANARPGLVLGLAQADGVFTLPEQRPDKVLLISGGSGITPVLSMLRTLVDEGHEGDVVFLHYAFTEGDVAHLADLRRLALEYPNVRLVLAYTRQTEGGDLHGLFDETHLTDAAPWYAEAPAYLCGPPGLMATIRAHYAAKGIEDLLHTEEFTPAMPAPVDGDATGEIRFGDTVVQNSGGTLLEQAESAGLTPEYGCRMGICFTCTKVKTSGCTRNVRTGELHSDPDTEVQLCISAPVGDVAIDI